MVLVSDSGRGRLLRIRNSNVFPAATASLAYGYVTSTPVRTSELGEEIGLLGASAVVLVRIWVSGGHL